MGKNSKITYFPSPKGNAKGPQQLPLFNMKPDNRWIRGYTPERKREMEAAMPPVTIGEQNKSNAVYLDGWAGDASEILRKVSQRLPSPEMPELGANADLSQILAQQQEQGRQRRNEVWDRTAGIQRKVAKRTISRTLARSKISPEALRNISSIDVSSTGSSAASYHPRTKRMNLTHLLDRDTSEQALFHEVGHANDPKLETSFLDTEITGNTGVVRTIGARIEGFAEGYGQANYVPRNIDPRQFVRNYDSVKVNTNYATYPLSGHYLYREGVKEGSGGTVDIAEEEKKRKLKQSQNWEQLSLDI